MERIIELPQVAETTTCPFISSRVVCYSCESPDFSIDANGQRPGKGWVPGRCDDCGYTCGIKLEEE